jgi:hypothetical protein
LVASGKFGDHAEALDYLLHHKDGQALLTRLNKKDVTMPTPTLESVFKEFGAVKVCKHICDTGKTGYTEHELVSGLTAHAASQHPELRPDARLSFAATGAPQGMQHAQTHRR